MNIFCSQYWQELRPSFSIEVYTRLRERTDVS